jgi:hypothetical protein
MVGNDREAEGVVMIFAKDSAFRVVLWHNSACFATGHGQC